MCVVSSTNHEHAIEDIAPSKASNQRNYDRFITNLIHLLADCIYPELMISSTSTRLMVNTVRKLTSVLHGLLTNCWLDNYLLLRRTSTYLLSNPTFLIQSLLIRLDFSYICIMLWGNTWYQLAPKLEFCLLTFLFQSSPHKFPCV